MDEVVRPRSNTEKDIDDEDLQSSIVCDLDVFNKYEMLVQQGSSENISGAGSKRRRNDEGKSSDEQEFCANQEGFTLVKKKVKKAKQSMENIAYKDNVQAKPYKRSYNNRVVDVDPSAIEICMSSNQVLPKQIGLAKLLKAENISNIIGIKYKNPNKVLINFETRVDAEKMLDNRKFIELGYKCHLTNEVSFTYGLVRYIELEIQEEELLQSFKGDCEIVAVKRLKRMSENNVWSDSETVRFCFKNATLPPYVFGYDCRFKVEPYTFPVTQCSVCWKFGHMARLCPSTKKRCPKCCGEHENCDTTQYRCINCKGKHMAFEKMCPVYLKEKKIRQIMCEQNCTYKIASLKFVDKTPKEQNNASEMLPSAQDRPFFTEPQINVTEAMIHDDSKSSDGQVDSVDDDDVNSEEETRMWGSSKQKKNKKKKPNSQKKTIIENRSQTSEKKTKKSPDSATISYGKAGQNNKGSTEEKKKEHIEHAQEKSQDKFSQIFGRVQKIFFARASLEEKIILVLKVLLEEAMNFLVGAVSNGEVVRKIINLFHDGFSQ